MEYRSVFESKQKVMICQCLETEGNSGNGTSFNSWGKGGEVKEGEGRGSKGRRMEGK